MKTILWIILAAVIIVGLAWFGFSKQEEASPEALAVAQWLTESGVKFYGAFWCPACQQQKQIFGAAASELPYIECSLPDKSAQTAVCQAEEIQQYPTWELPDGTRRTGVLSISQLKTFSGFNAAPGPVPAT